MRYELHSLAVLRGVCQTGEPGKFFGSFGALSYWIEEAIGSGLIEKTEDGALTATNTGRQIFDSVLSSLPQCRQVFWNSPELSVLLKADR